MPAVPIYTVDTFTDQLFRGNTCAVCIFPEWPEDRLLQDIAKQNLFAETAYIVPHANALPELRWFTTSQEVEFCGYGSLSAGYVYLTHLAPDAGKITFATRRYGDIPVSRTGALFEIEVPAKPPLEKIAAPSVYAALEGPQPNHFMTSARGDLLIVYNSEAEIKSVTPAFEALMKTGHYGYILTAPGEKADYAYRYFSPRMPGVWEDPVNGASQSVLAPYWAERLGKSTLHGEAVSTRGGDVYCRHEPGSGKVAIAGRVTPYLQGFIHTP